MNKKIEICQVFEDSDQSEIFSAIYLCANKLANYDLSDAQLAGLHSLLSSLKADDSKLYYDGNLIIECETVSQFLFQCETHFLEEYQDHASAKETRAAKEKFFRELEA